MDKTRVDHTYHDYSRYLEEGGEIVKHKKSSANFPAKLHRMLSDPDFSHIIAWMPHGRAWKILNKELLIASAVPAHFSLSRFESFTRQLSFWGFKRLYRVGADFGCYYHEKFLRGMPKLTELIERIQTNKGKLMPNAQEEPDFYRISETYPLPELPAETLNTKEFTVSSTAKQEKLPAVLMPETHPILHHNLSAPDLSETKHVMTHLAQVDCLSSHSGTADTAIHEESCQNLLNPSRFLAAPIPTPAFGHNHQQYDQETYGRAQINDLSQRHFAQGQPPMFDRQQDNTTPSIKHQHHSCGYPSGSYEGDHTFNDDMNSFFGHFQF